MSIRKRFARLDLFRGKPKQRAVARAQCTLHVERLEDRRLMNVDNPLAGGLAAADAATNIAVPPSAASASVEPSDTFQSREELRQWLIQLADQQFGNLFGQTTTPWSWYGGHVWLDGDVAVFRTMLAGAVSTNDASSTNVQVAGVDEADLVETDGQYLYIVSGQDLVIVKAGVGEELQIASRIHFDHAITGMYLDDDRLALVSTEYPNDYYPGRILDPWTTVDWLTLDASAGDPASQASPRRTRPTTTVTLLDVSDRTSPALVRTTELDGRLIATRAVDGQLRLVVANDFNLPAPIYRRVGEPTDQADRSPTEVRPIAKLLPTDVTILPAFDDYYLPWQNADYVYETRDEYISRVVDALLNDLPGVRELSLSGEVISETALVTPEGLLRPEANEIGSLTTVATIDMHGNGRIVGRTTVLAGQAATVYATEDDLYLMAPSSQLWNTSGGGNAEYQGPTTSIWKFAFAAQSHEVRLAARGKVDGTILNQFAADEHNGYLRVVTSGRSWGSSQQLFVLQQTGKRLSVVGQVDDIAPRETLHSVRFVGDRAFAVTFRIVDPLFAIDLSDPTNPFIAGELTIPGYSDYLQPIDATHLIGVGRDADPVTGQFGQLQVSIFDVSDLDDPLLVDRYLFGGGRSTVTEITGSRWAIGQGDHHAVSYFAAEQILAIPIYSDGYWSWASGADQPLFAEGEGGLQVFHINATGAIESTALIEHNDVVSRAVRLGDYLYAISPGAITVHSLEDPSIQLGELAIGPDAEGAVTPLRMFAVEQAMTSALAGPAVHPDDKAARLAAVDAALNPVVKSRSSQPKIGRAAAIEQIARAQVFGRYVIDEHFEHSTDGLDAVDQAFEIEASETRGAPQDDAFGQPAIASELVREFA